MNPTELAIELLHMAAALEAGKIPVEDTNAVLEDAFSKIDEVIATKEEELGPDGYDEKLEEAKEIRKDLGLLVFLFSSTEDVWPPEERARLFL